MNNSISPNDARALQAALAKHAKSALSPVAGIQQSPTPGTQQFSDVLAASNAVAQPVQPTSLNDDNDATEDRFLALLVAQMRNQDPMNPLENSEVTTQLAQINTVRGIGDLGTTLKELLSKFDKSNPVDSVDMVNRQVLLPSDSLNLVEDRDGALVGGAYVPASTGAVTARIFGADGSVIRRIELGPQPAGVATFEWDGKDDGGYRVTPGKYQFQVQSAGSDGDIELTPLAGAVVTGVTRGEQTISYRVEGGASVPANDVMGVF